LTGHKANACFDLSLEVLETARLAKRQNQFPVLSADDFAGVLTLEVRKTKQNNNLGIL
jgi:hypothetical protein